MLPQQGKQIPGPSYELPSYSEEISPPSYLDVEGEKEQEEERKEQKNELKNMK